MSMKPREKLLAGLIVGIGALAFVGVGLQKFFTVPIQKEERVIAALRDKLSKADKERKDYFVAEDQLKRVAQRSFGESLDVASARSGELIVNTIAEAGLSETQFTRLATGTRRLRGASEIGWTVQGRGPLQKVIDLLFLLDKSPYLHRLENISLTAVEKPGEVKVRFVFITLVMIPPPIYDPVGPLPGIDLLSNERQTYQPLVDRDLWRPYIKRPPTPPAPPVAPTPPPEVARSTPPAPTTPWESYRVVSLSNWGGRPEAHIRNLTDNRVVLVEPGEEFLGVEIVAIDYRSLPLPRNPALRSDSRIILRHEDEYWAVERGQTLADKRKLEPNLWPVE